MKLRRYPYLVNGQNLAPDEFGYSAPYGSLEPNVILIPCRCAKRTHCGVSIRREPAEHPFWQWDGNRDEPTLSPSINCSDVPERECAFHGHLIKGELK